MKNIIQNNWFVGIVGGIISGIIVYIITNWLIKRKDNTEYKKRIISANESVINSLKPYISDNGLPDKTIIKALISATARKYDVKPEEMYPIKSYCEELIAEIINNVYVSSDKKKEYINDLKNYIENLFRSDSLAYNDTEFITKSSELRNRKNQKMLIGSLAILSMILTFITVILESYFPSTNVDIPPEMSLAIIIVAIVTLMTLPLFIKIFLSMLKKHYHSYLYPKSDKNNTTSKE